MRSRANSRYQDPIISRHGRFGSLIDRLVADDEGGQLGNSTAEQGYVRSIRANLENILNSRVGTSAARPDYGLNDFNDGSALSSDMLRFVRDDIKRAITEFEPRLHHVTIEGGQPDSTIPQLQFRLICEVLTTDGQDKVAFTLAMEEGQIKVV